MSPVGDIRVLIIDDHRMFADSLAHYLTDTDGIAVIATVGSAAEALSRVGLLQPQVALVDQQLPDQSGVSIIAELKRLAPEMAVIMVTADTADRVLLGAVQAGCSAFVTKDRAASDVVDAVLAAGAGDSTITPRQLSSLLPRLRTGFASFGSDLTARELDVLIRMGHGDSNAEVAAILFLSTNTVRNYVQSILSKLDVHSKLEAVVVSVREGLITLEE